MSRLILVPQMPMSMRYSEWWPSLFVKEFLKIGAFDEVHVIGDTEPKIDSPYDFDIGVDAVVYEAQQVQEYMELVLRDDDTLLLLDLSFCGIFPSVLTLKRPKRCFAFCHATSKNAHDLFAPIRPIKWPIERAMAKVFDAVFVASEYHRDKIKAFGNVINLGALPNPPKNLGWGTHHDHNYQMHQYVVCVSRPTAQKCTKRLEKSFCSFYRKHLERPRANHVRRWEDYFAYVRNHKWMLVTSKEETYGYQVIDAILNDCIPICPNRCSYPELLPPEYLYDPLDPKTCWDHFELPVTVPRLLNQVAINLFFHNIAEDMSNHG